jgi:hypothetical protein
MKTISLLVGDFNNMRLLSPLRDENLHYQRVHSPPTQNPENPNKSYDQMTYIYYSYNSFTKYCLFELNQVCYEVRRIVLSFLKLITLKHDFHCMSQTSRDIVFDSTSILISIILYMRKYYIYIEFDIYSKIHTNKSYYKQDCFLQFDETETEKINCIGGSKPKRSQTVHFSLLQSFVYDNKLLEQYNTDSNYEYHGHFTIKESMTLQYPEYISCKIPCQDIINVLPKPVIIDISKAHGIKVCVRNTVDLLSDNFNSHECHTCKNHLLIFKHKTNHESSSHNLTTKTETKNEQSILTRKHNNFPPETSTKSLYESVINNWCKDFLKENVEEEGCTVCGELTLRKHLTKYDKLDFDKSLLDSKLHGILSVTRKERISTKDPIEELSGPVRDISCSDVCVSCVKELQKGNLPKNALANGIWLGNIPKELQDLSYAEQLLIARIAQNESKCYLVCKPNSQDI